MSGFPTRFRLRTLKFAFLFPGPDDPWINRVVAKVSKHPVCHVELVFEDDMSFSIFQGSELFFKPRTFSNPEYKILAINVSGPEYFGTRAFCEGAVKQNLGFTDVGMVGACMQPRNCAVCCYKPSEETGYTFCSKIITEALQAGKLPEVEGLHPCTTSPSNLLDVLSESPRRVCDTNSYKMSLVIKNAQVVFVNRIQ